MHAFPRARAHRPRRAAPRAAARLAALTTAAFAALALSWGAAAPALAHDELIGVSGELAANQETVALTLQFNNEIIATGAEFVATGPDGEDLLSGTPTIAGREVTQDIAFPGFDETVTVTWRVVSSDGHPISNRLAFSVSERDGGTEVVFTDVAETGTDDAASSDEGTVTDEETHTHDDADAHAEVTTAEDRTSESTSDAGLPAAAIVGIVIGAVVVIAVAGGLIAARRRSRTGTAADDRSTAAGTTPTDPTNGNAQ